MESCLSRPRSSSSVLYLLQFLVFGSQKFFALASWASWVSAFISPKWFRKKFAITNCYKSSFPVQFPEMLVCWLIQPSAIHPSETRFYSRASEGAGSHGTGLLGFYECRSETRWVQKRGIFWFPSLKNTGEKTTKKYLDGLVFVRGRTSSCWFQGV